MSFNIKDIKAKLVGGPRGLTHKTGDLLHMLEMDEIDIAVHGCNCQNVMGSGIAKTIRENYPSVYEADSRLHKYYVNNKIPFSHKLGTFDVVEMAVGDRCIVNAYTQNKISGTEDVFEYDAFQKICDNLLEKFGGMTFGFPYIGMGFARGNPDKIIKILTDFARRNLIEYSGRTYLVEFGPIAIDETWG